MSFRRLYFFIFTVILLFSVVLSDDENDISLPVENDSANTQTDSDVQVDGDFYKRGFNHRSGGRGFHGKMHLRGMKHGQDDAKKGVWGEIRHDSNPRHHHHHKTNKKNSWMDGFVHSTIMIVSMEFMDKTFFISAIMAMSHNKWIILLGSVAALFLMNGISCLMGVVLPMFMSRRVTVIVAAILFVFFGGKMILDGIKMDSNDTGEMDEAQEEIRSTFKPEPEHPTEDAPLLMSPTTEAKICKPHDNVVIQIFLMIFFAEWGDRSQVSTILLAGTHPVLSVFLGGCVGYFITSFIAVLCGSVLQKWISPRWITIFGGLMFLGFAFQTVFSH